MHDKGSSQFWNNFIISRMLSYVYKYLFATILSVKQSPEKKIGKSFDVWRKTKLSAFAIILDRNIFPIYFFPDKVCKRIKHKRKYLENIISCLNDHCVRLCTLQRLYLGNQVMFIQNTVANERRDIKERPCIRWC